MSTAKWPSASQDNLRNAYDRLLNSGASISKIRDAALGDRLLSTSSDSIEVPGRSVAWKLFLIPREPLETELSPTYLVDSLRHSRQSFSELILDKMKAPDGSYETDFVAPGASHPPRRDASANDNLQMNNPLSLHSQNPWKEWFSSVELRKTIRQDVERTFPDIDFFRLPEVQTELTHILFLWSVTHSIIGYRQGMHELLAPLYYAVQYDSLTNDTPESTNDSPLHEICARSWASADAWGLFDAVMKGVSRWYEWQEPINDTTKAHLHGHLEISNVKPELKPYVAPIVQECNRLQSSLLRSVDPDLWKHMQSTGIEPQIYGIRWLRLLFTRELSLPDSMKLWDGLFACDSTFDLAPWICVAMLIRIRNELLPSDYTGQLTALLRYPSPSARRDHPDDIHHASLLLRQALALQLSPTPAAGQSLMFENRNMLDIPIEVPEPPPVQSRRRAPPTTSPTTRSHPTTPPTVRRGSDSHDPHRQSMSTSSSHTMGYPEMLARGLMERGESLGINKTLMNAVTELRRNIPDLASSIASVRSPTIDGQFQLTDERPTGERPPWEPRSRLEMEQEITDLKTTNKRLGESLTWIVDTLLLDGTEQSERVRLEKQKREALESLAYVRDILNGNVKRIEPDRLVSEEVEKRKAQNQESRRSLDGDRANRRSQEIRQPSPLPVADSRPSHTKSRSIQVLTSPSQTHIPSTGLPRAPWTHTRSNFSEQSVLPTTSLPRPPPPTSTSIPRRPTGISGAAVHDPLGVL